MERFETTDMSAWGAGFISGILLGAFFFYFRFVLNYCFTGFWTKEQLPDFRRIDKIFKPNLDPIIKEQHRQESEKWRLAVQRFLNWRGEML